MSGAYSVVVTGKIADGFVMDQVKDNVSRLFKLNSEQVEKIFSGKPVAVRRGIDKEQALKLRSALTKAGALAVIRSVAEKTESTAKPATAAVTSAAQMDSAGICCPRCGHQQDHVAACGLCKMDLTLHIRRLQRKEQARAVRAQAAG